MFHADRLPVPHEYLAICTPPWPRTSLAVALGAGCSFVARAIDSDRAHLAQVLTAAAKHRGTSFVEMYQNCPIFNDGIPITHTPIGIFRDENRPPPTTTKPSSPPGTPPTKTPATPL